MMRRLPNDMPNGGCGFNGPPMRSRGIGMRGMMPRGMGFRGHPSRGGPMRGRPMGYQNHYQQHGPNQSQQPTPAQQQSDGKLQV